MKKSRVILSAIAAAAMIASVTSCGGKKSDAKKLVIWSFTDELQSMVDNYYKPDHPDVEVDYSLTPHQTYSLWKMHLFANTLNRVTNFFLI